MSCAGLLTTKLGNKYFLKYAGINSKGPTTEGEKVIESEWKYGIQMRLYNYIIYSYLLFMNILF
jgi:hypothetical protein